MKVNGLYVSKKMKEYNVYYRERGDKKGQEFNCTITCSNKKGARKNFENWDNKDNKWTITRIERN